MVTYMVVHLTFSQLCISVTTVEIFTHTNTYDFQLVILLLTAEVLKQKQKNCEKALQLLKKHLHIMQRYKNKKVCIAVLQYYDKWKDCDQSMA